MPRSRWISIWCLVLLGVATSGAALARPPDGPRVELLLAGPGDDIYARFGHVAMVVWDRGRRPLVYNYGYTDFNDPDLIINFLRGRSRFWLATARLSRTRREYIRQDRSLALQPLHLAADQQRNLASLLAHNAQREHRTYVYHHFTDNCSTRLRDLLDQVTGGQLSRGWRDVSTGATLRDHVRQGFAGRVEILLLSELLLGRVVDRPLDLWAGAFLPRILSAALQRRGGAGTVAGLPRELYHRRQPSPLAHWPLLGVALLWGGALLFLLFGLALAWRGAAPGRWVGFGLGAGALFLGACGALIWTVAQYSPLPELRWNELLLVLWPTDLLLLTAAWRWWRGKSMGRWLGGYAMLRLISVIAVLGGHVAGLLIQRPLCWEVMVMSLFAGLVAWSIRQRQMTRGD